MKVLSLAFCLLCLSHLSWSQTDSARYKYVGIGFGSNWAKTDLSETYQKPNIHFSAYLQFAKASKWNTAAALSYGQLVSENREAVFLDRSEIQVNSFAQVIYQTVHFELMYHLVKREQLEIALSQGIGFMRFNVYDQLDVNLADQLDSRLPGEDYAGFTALLPLSLSARYLFQNNWGLQSKLSLMNSLTDYLDNISEIGNPDNNDNFLRMELSVFKKLSF